MKYFLSILLAAVTFISVSASAYTYRFNNTPIAEALATICKDHPEANISFIYVELDKYKTSATINTDELYRALRQTIGLNPITVIKKGNEYYVEALQRGKYCFTGCVTGRDGEPVSAATVQLLAPRDSVVLTFGITDDGGCFTIPCDKQNVIGKFTRLGYETVYRPLSAQDAGTIVMQEKSVLLDGIKVEAANAQLSAEKSVYIPTSNQKKAAQTGTDLLDHMAIPQLAFISNGSVTTNTGRPVKLFIDYIPASEDDLKAMRVSDVRKVEFYEYPSDSRLQGNQYVVNFIMQKYEYGGYVKGFAHTNLISNPVAEGLGTVRFQYKKMTYDLMGSALGYDRKHIGREMTETFRLPQDDGEVKEFTRQSNTYSSKEKRAWYFATFKATYNSDKVQAVSQIRGRIDRTPDADRSGRVIYSQNAFEPSSYSSLRDEKSKFVSYNGYYFFSLPKSNTISFFPQYTYSRTEQNSLYTEGDYTPIENGAFDNTSQMSANLKYTHNFGKLGSLLGFVKGSYEYNRTRYTGSATALDRIKSSRIGIGAQYELNLAKISTNIGFGWDWDRLKFGDIDDKPSSPWLDLSFSYSPTQKHQASVSYSYSTWAPSQSHKSDKVIVASPLMKYTGNPALVPFDSHMINLSYYWIPDNNYTFGIYSFNWIVDNRYVFDYEATSSNVIRTIKQPLGSYFQATNGVGATLRFLDRNLVFSGNISLNINHNGKPYNVNHNRLYGSVSARYYLGNWNFSLRYSSKTAYADGCMNGIWVNEKSSWYASAGWSNEKWNINCYLANLTRWNYRGQHQVMHSKYYDTDETWISGGDRAFIQLSATYIIGFGKKVKSNNEPSVSNDSSSGILK